MAQGQARKVKKKKKSVLKRAAQSRERAEVNRTNRTRVRGVIKRLRTAITAGDATAAGNLLHPTMSAIDQAISKGVFTRIPRTATSRDLTWPTIRSKPRPQSLKVRVKSLARRAASKVARLFCFHASSWLNRSSCKIAAVSTGYHGPLNFYNPHRQISPFRRVAREFSVWHQLQRPHVCCRL